MSEQIGHRRWATVEGYIPSWSNGLEPHFASHETACILNASDEEAHAEITAYFSDSDPAGPYRRGVAPLRTLHQRFNEPEDPEPILRDTDYASVIESDVLVVVRPPASLRARQRTPF